MIAGAWVLAAIAGGSALAQAGECVDTAEHYVSAFEAGPDHREFLSALLCQQRGTWLDTPLWAGRAHAVRFAAARADTMVPRIAAAARRLLALPGSASAEWRRGVLAAAAAHGVARLDSLDVFAELFADGRRLSVPDYALMAILQDCRGVGILRARCLELRAGAAAGAQDEPVHVLSCLYHLPCDEALSLAKELDATETDEHLRERLRRVLERQP
ncbi:MAG: hypothetical protein IPK64_11060 [bacterium]|nr:hypothetical protein [bacterium]